MRAFFGLLLAVLLAPVLAIGIASIPYWHAMGITDPVQIAQIAFNCLTETSASSGARETCRSLSGFNYLGAGGVIVGGLGLGLIVVAMLLSLLTGWHRSLLALSFPVVALVSVLVISLVTLGQALLAAGGVYLLEVYFLEVVHPSIILIIGGIGVFLAFAMVRQVFNMFRTASTSVIGFPALPVDAPHIHRIVRNMAKEMKTDPPENIILGFDPNFFATSAKVYTPFEKQPLRGESLYLSLPLMRLLSEDETRSIIGHELAHFSGGDTLYSKRFAPAYRGLGEAQHHLSNGGKGAHVWSMPALVTINFVLKLFSHAERRISRVREMRADQIGSEMGSAEGLSRALVKVGILGQIWGLEFQDMVNRVRMGRFSRNLSKNFVERARYDVDHDKIAGLAALGLDTETAHPTDAHPVTRDRVEALEIDPDALVEFEAFKASLFPEKTLISRADGIDGIEEKLTDAYQHFILQATGQDISVAAQQENAFSNLLAMWVARMVTIDGDVDDAEIDVAQREAYQFFSGFDATAFREMCRHPEDLPPVEKMLYWANIMLTEDGAEKLKEILVKIAKADNVIHQAEQELLDEIDEALVGGMEPEEPKATPQKRAVAALPA